MLYAQHRAVCSSMLTKPLLPSQVRAVAGLPACCLRLLLALLALIAPRPCNQALPHDLCAFTAARQLQIALRMAVEVHTVHGAGGTALQQAVLRQMGAVQRSYQAAAAAAAAAGVVDE